MTDDTPDLTVSDTEQILEDLGMTPEGLKRSDAVVTARKAVAAARDALLDRARPHPHTIVVDGQRLHLYQKVYEQPQNPLDDSIIEWTVCGLDGGEVLLKDTSGWSRKEVIPHDEFDPDRYEPQWAADGTPLLGY